MLEVFYRNRYRPAKYVGLDIRTSQIEKNNEKFEKLDFATFKQADLCQDINLGEKFEIITCFEVFEHIGHANADAFLKNIWNHCNEGTTVYFSTPNYDPKVGAAENHILGDEREIGEWDHFELQAELEKFFTVEKKYGTFASMRDYKDELNEWQKPMFEALKEYYDTNLVANIMAPLVDASKARNCLWVLRPKAQVEA
jgi:cyclopropane fatty-acyl-phospholipid synthase-like methyltransferase